MTNNPLIPDFRSDRRSDMLWLVVGIAMMRLSALVLALTLSGSLLAAPAFSASGGTQSGSGTASTGGHNASSGGHSPAFGPPGRFGGNFAQPNFPGPGLAGPGMAGPGLAGPGLSGSAPGLSGRGFRGPGFVRNGNGGFGETRNFGVGRDNFRRDRDRDDFGRDRDRDDFGRGRFRGGVVVGVPAFIPAPDLLGLPYYDGFEYPYFYPGSGIPYGPAEIYAPAPEYLPPPAGYAPPEYIPPPTDGQPAQPIWYYCQDPMGYYPYVRDCNGPWQAVPASVLPPAQADSVPAP